MKGRKYNPGSQLELSFINEKLVQIDEGRQNRRRRVAESRVKLEESRLMADKNMIAGSRVKESVVPFVRQFSLEEVADMMRLLDEPGWSTPPIALDSIQYRDFRLLLDNPGLQPQTVGRLMDLYKKVQAAGGIVHCLSINLWKDIVSRFKSDWRLRTEDPRIYMQVYVKYVLRVEMEMTKQSSNSYYPLNLGYPNFWSANEFRVVKRQKPLLLEKELIVLESFNVHSRLDEHYFTANYLRAHYGDFTIDTRIQNPTAVGFKSEALFTKTGESTMARYIDYQRNYKEPEVQPLSASHHKNMVEFAVNIAINSTTNGYVGMLPLNYALRSSLNFIEEFQYLSEFDGLSYLDSIIEGCNAPQMYIKVKGCWTGGHQENASLASVNINHGPGESQWLTLEDAHVARLRIEVKKEFNIDIHKDEGLWFPEASWFMQRNYPIKKIVQKKGDLVYSGPGTMHWVRALGSCIHSAWNVMPKTKQQLESSKQRTSINELIRFPQTVIPFKYLTLKILNHEYLTNPAAKCMEDFVEGWLNEEAFVFNATATKHSGLHAQHAELPDTQTFCCDCKKEIFQYYSYQSGSLICLKCTKSPTRTEIYTKVQASSVRELLGRSRNWREHRKVQEVPEVLELCNGNFKGIVNYCHVIKARHAPDNKLILDTTNNSTKVRMSGIGLSGNGMLKMRFETAQYSKPHASINVDNQDCSFEEVLEIPRSKAPPPPVRPSKTPKNMREKYSPVQVKQEQPDREQLSKNITLTKSFETGENKQSTFYLVIPNNVESGNGPGPVRQASPRSRSRNIKRDANANAQNSPAKVKRLSKPKNIPRKTKNRTSISPISATASEAPIVISSLTEVNENGFAVVCAAKNPRSRRNTVQKKYNEPSEVELNAELRKVLKDKHPKTQTKRTEAGKKKLTEPQPPSETVVEARSKQSSKEKHKPINRPGSAKEINQIPDVKLVEAAHPLVIEKDHLGHSRKTVDTIAEKQVPKAQSTSKSQPKIASAKLIVPPVATDPQAESSLTLISTANVKQPNKPRQVKQPKPPKNAEEPKPRKSVSRPRKV